MHDQVGRTAPVAADSGGRPKRIATLGWQGAENVGNDGCLEAFVAFVRRALPDAHITAICAGPARVRAALGIDAIPMRWEPRALALRALNKALLKAPSLFYSWSYAVKRADDFDVILVSGSGLIDNYRTTVFDRPATLRRWAYAAKRRGVKFGFVSVGANPIRSWLSRSALRPVPALTAYRSYGDEGSRAYMHSLGVDESETPVCPDLAWALPEPPAARGDDGRLTVGVGVMAHYGWKGIRAGRRLHEAYVAKTIDFVDWLADQGYRIQLLVGERADMRVVKKIEERSRAAGTGALASTRWTPTLYQLMEEIQKCDVVVAQEEALLATLLATAGTHSSPRTRAEARA
ncbi:MAG: hypothetical protein GC206_01740 [Alphaproteobacteria bacterium]|nr:hypothetical protein [Alphaproteobacteria bacterium]